MANLLNSFFYVQQNSLHLLEAASRLNDMHRKIESSEAKFTGMRSRMTMALAGEEEAKRQLEVVKSEKSLVEQKMKDNETKYAALEKLLHSKDEELLEKIGFVAQKSVELEGIKVELEKMVTEFAKFKTEQANLRAENERLRVKLKGKSLAMDKKDETIRRLEEKHARGIKEKEKEQVKSSKAQHKDFLNQMMEARNDYFLEGWEATMIQTGIDSSSPIYRNVLWPNPYEAKPSFSFDRPPQTPNSRGRAQGR